MNMKTNVYSDLSVAMPPENYLTNCLAFLMKRHPNLVTLLFGKLFHDLPKEDQITTIKTQNRIGAGIADIRIRFKGSSQELVLENKFGSRTDPKQLMKYLKEPRRRVVLIAKNVNDVNILNKRFRKLRWFEVSGLLSSQIRNNEAEIRDFIQYLDNKGIELIEFKKEEVGRVWEKYLWFRKAARVFLEDELKELKRFRNSNRSGRYGLSAPDSKEFGYWYQIKGQEAWAYYVCFELDNKIAKMGVGVYCRDPFKQKLESHAKRFDKIRSELERIGFDFRLDIDAPFKWIGKRRPVKTFFRHNWQEQLAELKHFRQDTFDELKRSRLISLLRDANRS